MELASTEISIDGKNAYKSLRAIIQMTLSKHVHPDDWMEDKILMDPDLDS